jgi:hypothetical protein
MRILMLLLTLSSGAYAASEPQTLERLLGPEAYRAMGLHKLTPVEREELLKWVLARNDIRPVQMGTPTVSFGITAADPNKMVVKTTPAAPDVQTTLPPAAPAQPAVTAAAVSPQAEASLFGIEQTEQGVQEIRARIVGEFTGWDGRTDFVLDNGQVWRQSTSGTYKHRATAPEVTITRALVGYKLRLVETKRSINVRRVK